MNLVEKICEELGVEIGEEWLASDGHTYKITRDGRLFVRDHEWIDVDEWANIISGHLKPVWKPKWGEAYYTPTIKINKDYRYCKSPWHNDDIDQWYLSNNLVFKTKEEAIECANKMLELAKHGI